MSLFDALWPAWVVAFFVIEGFALWQDKRHPAPGEDGFTLSEHIRRWFHTRSHNGRIVFVVVWGIFGAAFVPHILGHGWF